MACRQVGPARAWDEAREAKHRATDASSDAAGLPMTDLAACEAGIKEILTRIERFQSDARKVDDGLQACSTDRKSLEARLSSTDWMQGTMRGLLAAKVPVIHGGGLPKASGGEVEKVNLDEPLWFGANRMVGRVTSDELALLRSAGD
ncbi:uncharacterized protein BJX67DRAFT_382789 [Aspergillus lucknowensis]|uniref:Uncharacterized protein n=1 Tax=Aspergillus lucknowensis TaxID=176173 RepID=A0ABR4LM06_9EURO